MAPGFLVHSNTHAVLRKLAAAESLVVVVGAGVSAEAGVPTWPRLVEGLVRTELVPRLGMPPNEVDRFWASLSAADPLPAIAAHVQARMTKTEFETAVRALLFPHGTPSPGPLARCIAELVKDDLLIQRRRPEVITTNYDSLIVAALKEAGLPPDRIKQTVQKKRYRPAVIPVRHLHGIVTGTGVRGQLVLGERDYYAMQVPSRWQEEHFRSVLRDKTVIFVGTSLADPNLLRYLYRSKDGGNPRHVALFTEQFSSALFEPPLSPEVAEARNASSEARWRDMGVRPLRPTFGIETAQFIYELALRRLCLFYGTHYRTPAVRLQQWLSRAQAASSPLGSVRSGFGVAQDRLQVLLKGWLDEIRRRLNDWGVADPTEMMGLHLWIRSGPSTLLQWGSSDRAWRDASTLQSLAIQLPTPWIAVEAYCAGTVLDRTTEEHVTSRWNHVLGIPIVLHDPPNVAAQTNESLGLLPVGVVTLASSRHHRESSLGRLTWQQQAEIASLAADGAADLLGSLSVR